MRRSIRYQLVALLGAMLVGAMVTYLALASRIVTADKLASVYDVNALLALGYQAHTHHPLAGGWLAARKKESGLTLATCAITELGFENENGVSQ